MVDLKFTLRSGEQLDSIDPKTMSMFPQANVDNLHVAECVWNMDSRMKQNWIGLLQRLMKHKEYHNRIGYNVPSKSFIFKLRPKSTTEKIVCWNCTTNHTPVTHNPLTIWGLPFIMCFINPA